MTLLQKLKEMFDESARVTEQYVQSQFSCIDNLKNAPNFVKTIYKANVTSLAYFGESLFRD
jgi:CRISPR/Cas system CMR-associated protein Cmr1 (group 7 of RAMP superfamily)